MIREIGAFAPQAIEREDICMTKGNRYISAVEYRAHG